MKPAALTLSFILLALPASAGPAAPDRGDATPELVVLYDFYDVGGDKVFDGSGRGHGGSLQAGEVVFGRNKPAVKLDGRGWVAMASVPADLDLTAQPMTVGAMARPSAPDGVVAAMGDAKDGFSLYLLGGVPHFAVRVDGTLHEVVAPEPVVLDQWVHLAGVADAKGRLTLVVDTWPVAQADGQPLARASAEPLVVGADTGSLVGPYTAPLHWTGLLQDVRLYRGVVSRDETRDLLGEWAQRPGCGCRK